MNFGVVHAATSIIVVVEAIFVLIKHFMSHERLIGDVRVAHIRRNWNGRNVHLGVRGVAVALSVIVVKQIWVAVRAWLATAHITGMPAASEVTDVAAKATTESADAVLPRAT